MKILVIGGSYFLGRVFVYTACKEHDVTVLNRGTRPLRLENVREVRIDRHDEEKLQSFAAGEMRAASGAAVYDAVVDFCAFNPGEIRTAAKALRGLFQQYIFISTVDVLERTFGGSGTAGAPQPKKEDAPYETRYFGGQTGDYITGKVMLEKELKEISGEEGVCYTIVRPVMVYGPFNYAPREAYYVKRIAAGEPVFEPEDADGQFQFVYVRDAARMILALCGKEGAEGEIFHLAPPEYVTYRRFFALLESMHFPDADIRKIRYADAGEQYFPFPVTARETELYTGDKITALTGIPYTEFETGMGFTLQNLYESLRK